MWCLPAHAGIERHDAERKDKETQRHGLPPPQSIDCPQCHQKPYSTLTMNKSPSVPCRHTPLIKKIIIQAGGLPYCWPNCQSCSNKNGQYLLTNKNRGYSAMVYTINIKYIKYSYHGHWERLFASLSVIHQLWETFRKKWWQDHKFQQKFPRSTWEFWKRCPQQIFVIIRVQVLALQITPRLCFTAVSL